MNKQAVRLLLLLSLVVALVTKSAEGSSATTTEEPNSEEEDDETYTEDEVGKLYASLGLKDKFSEMFAKEIMEDGDTDKDGLLTKNEMKVSL